MDEAAGIERRLTMIQRERERSETEQMGFTRQEHDNMQEWYNQEVKGNPRKAQKAVEKMFKDIENDKMRRIISEFLIKNVRI